MKNFFGLIEKSEDLEDGTIKVWGFASTEDEDSDGEIILSSAIEKALPDYLKFSNIREMHGSSAAGTTFEASVSNGKTFIGAHIVDPVAVKKVKTKTYKGFSIGGKVLKRNKNNPNIIEEIKLVEISLVDRPANPGAVFTMYKSEQVDNNNEILDNIENKESNMENNEVIKEETIEVSNDKKEDNLEVSNEVIKEEKKEDLKKGLVDVARLSILIEELYWLKECLNFEKEMEEDESKIPEDLSNVIKDLSSILINLAIEETSELTNEDKNDTIKQDNNLDILKAGSRNSKNDQEKIQKIHDLALELGAISPSIDKELSDKNEDLEKFNNIEKSLEKAIKLNEELEKRVKELESLPKPQKGVSIAVSKSEELGFKEESYVVKNEKGLVDDVATAILKAQRSPKN